MPAPVSATQNSTSPSRGAAPTVIAPPALRELDRVADQVLEDLHEPVAIGADLGQIARQVELQLERRRRGERLPGPRRNRRRPVRVGEAHRLDRQAVRLHARDVEQILDQAIHAARRRARSPRPACATSGLPRRRRCAAAAPPATRSSPSGLRRSWATTPSTSSRARIALLGQRGRGARSRSPARRAGRAPRARRRSRGPYDVAASS